MKPEEREILNNLLSQVKSPGYQESDWLAVAQRLDKKRKRRQAILHWLSLGSLTALGIFCIHKYYFHPLHINSYIGIQKSNSTNNIIPFKSIEKERNAQNTAPQLFNPAVSIIDKASKIAPVIQYLETTTGPTISVAGIHLPNELTHSTSKTELLLNPKGIQICAFSYIAESQVLQTSYDIIRKKNPDYSFSKGWNIEAGMGINHANQLLRFKTGGDQEYFHRRSNEEKNAIYFSPKIALVHQWKSGFSISIGMEYQGYGEKTAYLPYSKQWQVQDHYTYSRDSIPVFNVATRQIVWRIDSNTYVSKDTALTNKTDASIAAKNGKTQIHYLEFPISFGYSIQYKKFTFGIKAGASFGWLQRSVTQGYYLNEGQTGLVNLRSQTQNFNRFMVNGILQCRVSMQMNAKSSLFLDPSLKWNTTSIYSNQRVSQKYLLTGAYFGVRVSL